MSFSTQHVKNYYLYDTEIENLFISEYMPSAPGNYVKLFLYALMSAESDLGFDNETAARKLGMSLAEVVEGWTYWESQGLVRKTCPDPSDRDRFDIEFLNIKEAAFGRRSSEEDLPQTSVKLDDRELSTLFGDVEKATGRILESGEPEEISSWIRDFGADPEVIVLAYTYCSRNRRSNRYRYVGTVIKDWLAKRLTTAQDVEEYLATVDRHYDLYKKVCRELGFHRNPTEPEKRIMDSWFGEMGFTIEKVLEACQKTAGIANPNIKYVDSILRDWKSEEK
ncbi:MAG: DnaD domain protein, partial [Firmicutes bacterium]|nr:DnaD domain protein [Bacillota bacterium]